MLGNILYHKALEDLSPVLGNNVLKKPQGFSKLTIVKSTH